MANSVYQGLRVLDFTQGVAGSLPGRLLADYGAIVVHVESMKRVDITRVTMPYKDDVAGVNRGLLFGNYHACEYSVTLDMEHPKSAGLARKLFAWADVALDSRVSGVMEKWGFAYDDVVKIRPDIIMMRFSNQGQKGPYARYKGYGFHVMGQSGFSNTLGWPDREPLMAAMGMYPDLVAGRIASAVVLAAVNYRQRTGRGQLLDFSMVEAGIGLLAPQVLDYHVNRRDLFRMGNRSSYAAPHGAYPCFGNDSWCVIAVFSDNQWERLCECMGNPEWTKDVKFSTLLARKAHESELDSLVSQWTSERQSTEIVSILQAAGVPAGRVTTIPETCDDPQVRYREHFPLFDHLELGQCHQDDFSFRLSRTPSRQAKGVPCLGQDNEYVYCNILGLSDQEFADLLSEGVFE